MISQEVEDKSLECKILGTSNVPGEIAPLFPRIRTGRVYEQLFFVLAEPIGETR